MLPGGDTSPGDVGEPQDTPEDLEPVPDRTANFPGWYKRQVAFLRATARGVEQQYQPKSTLRRPNSGDKPRA